MEFHYVYVLQSIKDNNFYVGYTIDINRRIKQHNAGESFATKSRRSFKLVYCEICLLDKDAFGREKYLKTAWGKRYIKNRIKNYLKNNYGKK